MEANNANYYSKKGGTSGISGQLYETRLLSLILYRALCDDNTIEFVLGTNVDGVGAFDDIILKYRTNDMQTSKIIFLQAKHRENPSKDKLTIEDLKKQSGDFSLHKYFESYYKIKQKCWANNDDILFQGSSNIDLEFIIYTSAEQNFTNNKDTIKELSLEDTTADDFFIKTSTKENVFQIQVNDITKFDFLVATVTKTRIELLAKKLSKFILRQKGSNNNFQNMMWDELIRIYHPYLALHVTELQASSVSTGEFNESTITHSTSCESSYYIAKFRRSFLSSEEKGLKLLRDEISKEITKIREESTIETLTFKLPANFGNHCFHFNGSEKKQQRRLDYMCSIFHKLFQNVFYDQSNYIYVKLDDSSVGPNKILERRDLESCRLGGLVGNMLVNDDETGLLKFNMTEESLTTDNKKILERLKGNYDLDRYRLDIRIHEFPKLVLNCFDHDCEMVKDFLNSLKIYTNQAKEDEVENMLKEEIQRDLIMQQKLHDPFIRVKCEAVVLKFHDKIQKWWQQPTSAPYLTQTCKFYQQAKRDIINTSVLNLIHFTCYEQLIKKKIIEFNDDAINSLRLEEFLANDKRIMLLVSDDTIFSTLKVIQYLDKIQGENNYLLIDLEYTYVVNYLQIIHSEIECSEIAMLVLKCQDSTNFTTLNNRIDSITKLYKGKIIIITHSSVGCNLKIAHLEHILYRDDKNNFSSLSSKVCKMILEEREVTFQGVSVMVKNVLDDASLNLLSSSLLYKIVHSEKIAVGRALSDNFQVKEIDYYVNRSLYRYVELKIDETNDNICLITDTTKGKVLKNTTDIVLLTESENFFVRTYEANNHCKVHWCNEKDKNGCLIWKQSQGCLRSIMKYAHRKVKDTYQKYTIQPNTFKDIQEKVVIISAEPGMGKSTLMTHLAINTKCKYPMLWILNINLLEPNVLERLHKWAIGNININFREAMTFLYSMVDTSDNRIRDIHEQISKFLILNDNHEIYLDECSDTYLKYAELSEIKLFNYFYHNNNVAVVFDGFDEICPNYANEVIQLLCALKASKVAHLWISSRRTKDLKQLESALGTFSFNLNSLTIAEQNQILETIWSLNLGLSATYHIRQFCTLIRFDLDENFMSLPLNLYMIAEIYQNDVKKITESKICNRFSDEKSMMANKHATSLATFYEMFTNKKFDIQFGEKNPSMNSKAPTIQNLKENERKAFHENHKKLSAYVILNKQIVLSKYDIKVKEFIKKINSGEEKTGIIEARVSSSWKFIHRTFAEYYAVEFIFDKLKSGNCSDLLWKYFIHDILTFDSCGVRRFVNSKLQIDQSIISHLKSNRRHRNAVFNILIAQLNELTINAIFAAIYKDLEYIAIFLIECLKMVVNKDNLPKFIEVINRTCNTYCICCVAVLQRKYSIINGIKEIFNAISYNKFKDLCRDLSKLNKFLTPNKPVERFCVSLNLVIQDDQRGIELMIELLSSRQGYWTNSIYWSSTGYWSLGNNGFLLRFCFDYLSRLTREQQLKAFSYVKPDNQLSYFANQNVTDFYNAMNTLLVREKKEKLCTTPECASVVCSCIVLKNILKEIYLKPDVDLEDFVSYKLPEMQPPKIPDNKKYGQYFELSPLNTIRRHYIDKLFNLILLRSLCDDKVNNFLLASDSQGTYNDITLRYNTIDTQKTKMIFLETICIDNPTTEKLTVENILLQKINGKLYLQNCFKKYLEIKERFDIGIKHEIVYQNSMKTVECNFIIYTNAAAEYSKNEIKECSDEDNFMKTCNHGKIFQLTNVDVDILVSAMVKSRASKLAGTLSAYLLNFISFRNMMSDEIIKTYHVFLIQHVISIEAKGTNSTDSLSSDDHYIGKFKESFLKSNEETFLYMRRAIYERMGYVNIVNKLKNNKKHNKMISYSFKLPLNFCEHSLNRDEIEKENMIIKFCSIFKKMFDNVQDSDSKYCIVELDDDEIISKADLVGKNSIAELVGNLLVHDDETDMLKFNSNVKNLSADNIEILQRLKSKDLNKYRFDINLYGFPKLALTNKNHDRRLVQDFFSKLKFYTNQGTVHELEQLLKTEMHNYFNVQKKHNDFLFRVKCDAIFTTNIQMQNKFGGIYNQSHIFSTEALNWTIKS